MKTLKYFLYEKYNKLFCNVPEQKYLAALRILYPFIKSLINNFVDVASTLFDSSFNSFSTSRCFALSKVILLLKLLLKSVLLTKLAISLLLAKFACFNVAAKFSDVIVLNSEVVMYLLL